MTPDADMVAALRARLAALQIRAGMVEDELRQPLDRDAADQAVDLADDDALAGVDAVLNGEIDDTRRALLRIESGDYGRCARCGDEIAAERLRALPTAVHCVSCAERLEQAG